MEIVRDGAYSRNVHVGARTGHIRIALDSEDSSTLALEISPRLSRDAESIITRVRHLFDLDADPEVIDGHLAAHGFAASVDRLPGVRVPGAFDGFELAVRGILGQQVTVKGATTLMSRMVSAFGDRVDTGDPALTHLPPTAARVASASIPEIRSIGLPLARATTLHALAERVARSELDVSASADAATLIARITEVPGIGPWTAQYVAMRALHWSDAFPASDIALRRAAGGISVAELVRAADAWRPWRAYAAMRLWLNGRTFP